MSNNKLKNKILFIISILAGMVSLYFALAYPFILNRRISDKLEIEEQKLENYVKLINQKPQKDSLLEFLTLKSEKYKEMLLEYDKPPVVAARLQNTLKEMAEEEGVSIISEKQLPIEEYNLFTKIPITITLRCSITKLTNLVYAIEDYKKFLDISKIDISVINIRNPTDVKASITVSGFIFAKGISKET